MLSDCYEMLGPCLRPEGNMGIFVLVGGLHHGSVAPSVDQAALLVSESAVLLGPSGGCLPGAQLLEPMACSSRSVPPYSFHRERRSSTTSASHCLPLFLSTVFLQPFLQSPQHCPGASLPCVSTAKPGFEFPAVCLCVGLLVRGQRGGIKVMGTGPVLVGLAAWVPWCPGLE